MDVVGIMRRGHAADAANDKLLLGRYIARHRASRNLTQTALAGRLGVKQTTVSEWEQGRSFPDIALWPRIAHELGVTPQAMAEVIWGPWSKTDAGEPVTIEDLAAQLAARAARLRDEALRRGQPS